MEGKVRVYSNDREHLSPQESRHMTTLCQALLEAVWSEGAKQSGSRDKTKRDAGLYYADWK